MNARTSLVLTAIALVSMVALAGCSTGGGQADATPTAEDPAGGVHIAGDDDYRDGTLRRYVDREAGVVCWEKSMPDGTSIDCLPIEQTDLRP